MNTKFNIGDRVRLNNNTNHIISKVLISNEDGVQYQFEGYSSWTDEACILEVLPEITCGSIVRLVTKYHGCEGPEEEVETGVVINAFNNGYAQETAIVAWDDGMITFEEDLGELEYSGEIVDGAEIAKFTKGIKSMVKKMMEE